MWIYAGNQAFVFCVSVVAGILCGCMYSCLRIFRKCMRAKTAGVFAADIVFWAASAIIVFASSLKSANGELRGFQLFGVLLGAVIYFSAISVFFEKALRAFIKFMRRLLSLVLVPFRAIFSVTEKIVLFSEVRCGKFGLIVMFFHNKLIKSFCSLKKIKKRPCKIEKKIV